MSKQQDEELRLDQAIYETRRLRIHQEEVRREEKRTETVRNMLESLPELEKEAFMRYLQSNYTPNPLVEQQCLETRIKTIDDIIDGSLSSEVRESIKAALIADLTSYKRQFQIHSSPTYRIRTQNNGNISTLNRTILHN